MFNPTWFYGKRSSPTQTGSQGTPGFFPSKPWHLPVFFWSGKSEKMDRSDRCLPNFSDKVNKWNIWQNIREISRKYLAKTAKTPSMPEVAAIGGEGVSGRESRTVTCWHRHGGLCFWTWGILVIASRWRKKWRIWDDDLVDLRYNLV